ncbi:MAG: sigma-70 family RNA polymerase sigma factor [Planctomycetes bacterium]|nr:sigma-70 family RNA polymerase sigma factor [Planctomycetota bacterium]
MSDTQNRFAESLERYRPYLRLLARQAIGQRFQGKIEPSDVVQETLLGACNDWEPLRSFAEPELLAGLRTRLQNDVKDAVDYWTRGKRDVGVEQHAEQSVEESHAQLGENIAADQTSPSEKVIREELLVRFAEALEQLTAAQRTAIELRHIRGWSLKEISKHMGRTDSAVAGLLRDGKRKLSAMLREDE